MKKIFTFILILSSLIILTNCQTTKNITLQQLIKEGKTQEAKDSFASKFSVNEIDEDGNTALHIAAAMNNVEMVEFLVFKKADIDIKNLSNQTPLHVAIENNAIDAARSLVSLGANIFARTAVTKQRLKPKYDESDKDEYEDYEEEISAIDLALTKNNSYYDIFISEKTMESRDPDDGSNIIHYFVKHKNVQAINFCVQKKLSLSIPDNSGKTPLDLAFVDVKTIEDANVAAALVLNGADEVDAGTYNYFQTALQAHNLDYRFDDNQTPLHIAIISGHQAIVQYLTENHAALNVQDTAGSTPLHEAVRYGKVDVATMLLKAGADPNAKDNIGKTPLLLIIPHECQDEMYKLLLSSNANATVKDTYGDNVLHIATMTSAPVELLDKFVAAGAEMDARNKEGVTPLSIAVEKNVTKHIKYYADKGANIHTRDTKCNTPLTLALKESDSIVDLVVNSRNVYLQDSSGNTPLHIAIINNATIGKIQHILSLMNDVDVRNSDGNTPLYIAVLRNRKKVGELLFQKNADVFAANNKNRSPLSLALNAGGSVMDWILTQKVIEAKDGSGNTALHYAAEWGLDEAISAIIKKGGNAEARNANGETPLFSACKSDNPTVIAQLVQEGSKVNARDNLGSTPLHIAIRWENFNSAAKLLSLGAQIDAQNVAGKSPLSEAALLGKYDIAKMLLDKGADPNTSDSGGRTILTDAVRSKNTELINLLLSYNANPNIQEVNGRNSYHEAVLTGDKNIIEVVRSAGGNPLARDKNGQTPFSLALKENENIIFSVLGSDKTVVDSDGNTPVHIVVKNNCPTQTLSNIVQSGYPCDTRNSEGYTPLGIAVEANNKEYCEVLLSNGANPFTMIDKKGKNPCTIALEKNNEAILASIVKYSGKLSDSQGNTILHYAAKNASEAVVSKLLSYGLDKNVKNISNETPYMTATRWGRNNVASLLNVGNSSNASKSEASVGESFNGNQGEAK